MEITETAASPAGLSYTSAPYRWCDGLPLGNGLLGMVIWGATRSLNLSLDRSDLWDDRPHPLVRDPHYRWKTVTDFVRRDLHKEMRERLQDRFCPNPTPTRTGGCRLTLDFGQEAFLEDYSAELDYQTAIARARWKRRASTVSLEAFVHAEIPVIVIRIRGMRPVVKFHSRFMRDCAAYAHESKPPYATNLPSKLGYPPPDFSRAKDGVHCVLQRMHGEQGCALAWQLRHHDGDCVLMASFVTGDSTGEAAENVRLAFAQGVEALRTSHRQWWSSFWNHVPEVKLADEKIEWIWRTGVYFMGANARGKGPPVALHGTWSPDTWLLPPWRGDYHNNFNTQLSYWPVCPLGLFELTETLADYMLARADDWRAETRRIFEVEGLWIPAMHGWNGNIIPGCVAVAFSVTSGIWLLHALWRHYELTEDDSFLRKIYSLLRDASLFLHGILRRGRDRKLHFDFSTSPEFEDLDVRMFGKDSTFDLSVVRWIFRTVVVSSEKLRADTALRAKLRKALSSLADYPVAPEKSGPWRVSPERGLAVWKDLPLIVSHRHLSHLMPIYPFKEWDIEKDTQARALVLNSLTELEVAGTGFYTGSTFAWLSCLVASIRQPQRAAWQLHRFFEMLSANGFHMNADTAEVGSSRFHHGVLTLEGNFAAVEAVHEMLLQCDGRQMRVFPAVPETWKEIEFQRIRARGGLVVSAKRQAGKDRIQIISKKNRYLELLLNPGWQGKEIKMKKQTNSTASSAAKIRLRLPANTLVVIECALDPNFRQTVTT